MLLNRAINAQLNGASVREPAIINVNLSSSFHRQSVKVKTGSLSPTQGQFNHALTEEAIIWEYYFNDLTQEKGKPSVGFEASSTHFSIL